MVFRMVLCLSLLAGLMAGSALAEEAAERRAAAVASFIEETTVAVGRVDLAEVDIEALLELVMTPAPPRGPAREEYQRRVDEIRDFYGQLRDAGAEELYLLFGLADLPKHPLALVLPIPEGADAERLTALIEMLPFEVHRQRKGTIFAGSAAAWERLEQLGADPRPELTAAFAAAGEATASILLLPPAHAARAIEEILPQLPEELGGGPSTVLTRGIRWAALSVDGPPSWELRLVVQSDDAAAAADLAELWKSLLIRWQADESVRRHIPVADALAELAMPCVEGDRVILDPEAKTTTRVMGEVLMALGHRAQTAAGTSQSMRNLRQIAIAMHDNLDLHGHFPAPANYDDQGRPLLSWRVHLLPFLDEKGLYDQFRLDEPWDSEHNRRLIPMMPELYLSPLSELDDPGKTRYVVPVGEGAAFEEGKNFTVRDIRDGTVNTIMMLEVEDSRAVLWTAPEDYAIPDEVTGEGLHSTEEGVIFSTLDGSVHFLPLPDALEMLGALFTRAGGEVVNLDRRAAQWW